MSVHLLECPLDRRWLAAVALYLVACGAALGVYGVGGYAAQLLALFAILTVVSLVDVHERRIPNACIACACALRASYLLLTAARGSIATSLYARQSLVGMMVGVIPLLACALLLARDDAAAPVGGGDLKLVAVLGLFLGPLRVLLALALACVLMIAMGLAEGVRGHKRPILQATLPFGPPLAAAGCVLLLVGV